MPVDRAEAATAGKAPNATWLFFKRWMANPLTMASITPSSPSLSRLIAKNVRREPDEVVVEYGGGTGPVTRVLLESGIPASRLYTCEIDPELADYLRRNFPDVNLIQGDVRNITDLLPPQHIGKVGTVIVGIPMVLLPWESQQKVVEGIFKIMPPGRHFLAYTYSLASPLKHKELGLNARRVGFTMANVPPAHVWAFTKA